MFKTNSKLDKYRSLGACTFARETRLECEVNAFVDDMPFLALVLSTQGCQVKHWSLLRAWIHVSAIGECPSSRSLDLVAMDSEERRISESVGSAKASDQRKRFEWLTRSFSYRQLHSISSRLHGTRTGFVSLTSTHGVALLWSPSSCSTAGCAQGELFSS